MPEKLMYDIPGILGYKISQYCLIYDSDDALVKVFKNPSDYWMFYVNLSGQILPFAFVVASAFVPNPSSLPFVSFVKEGIYLPSNLFWSDHKYIPVKYRTAISWDMVVQMRELHNAGVSVKSLAERFGVAKSSVSKIIRRSGGILTNGMVSLTNDLEGWFFDCRFTMDLKNGENENLC
jgi:hypothetical protein